MVHVPTIKTDFSSSESLSPTLKEKDKVELKQKLINFNDSNLTKLEK